MKWEYNLVTLKAPTGSTVAEAKVQAVLNTLGEDQWELIHVFEQGRFMKFLLKRGKKEILKPLPEAVHNALAAGTVPDAIKSTLEAQEHGDVQKTPDDPPQASPPEPEKVDPFAV